jgi:hypothetical protein
MVTMHRECPVKADLWPAYRLAFKEFAQKVGRFQFLESSPNQDQAALAAATLELENARVTHNFRRDALVRQLMRRKNGESEHLNSILGRWRTTGEYTPKFRCAQV